MMTTGVAARWAALILAAARLASPGVYEAPAETSMQLPAEVRQWFINPDGSCVQCSLGMLGAWNNVPEATTLLWSTPYGPAERGGAWPERVARYSLKRGMPIYNVTGEPTLAWMEWAAKTGRFAGLTFGAAHFQTLYGRGDGYWLVCDNNSPWQIDKYTDAEFARIHNRAGPWCVILVGPAPPDPPRYVKWW